MFKLPGYNQFLEINATSKEIILFHDNGFVPCCDLLAVLINNLGLAAVAMLSMTESGCKCRMVLSCLKVVNYFPGFFFACSSDDEF